MLFLISKIISNPLIGGQEKLTLSVHVDLTKTNIQINRHNSVKSQTTKTEKSIANQTTYTPALVVVIVGSSAFPFFDTFLGSFLLITCFQGQH